MSLDVRGQGPDDLLPVPAGAGPEEHDGPPGQQILIKSFQNCQKYQLMSAGQTWQGQGRGAEDPAEDRVRDGGEDRPVQGPGHPGLEGGDRGSQTQTGATGEDRGEYAQIPEGLQVDSLLQTG